MIILNENLLTYFPYTIFGYVLNNRVKINGIKLKNTIRLVVKTINHFFGSHTSQEEENKTTDDLLNTKSALHVVKPPIAQHCKNAANSR